MPYGPAIPYQNTVHVCSNCGSSVDYTKVFTKEYDNALKKSEEESIPLMLDYLKGRGMGLSYIERVLGLSMRTLSRVKANGDTSTMGLALLRIIRTYPWILIAFDPMKTEGKFDPAWMKKTFLTHAFKEVTEKICEG